MLEVPEDRRYMAMRAFPRRITWLLGVSLALGYRGPGAQEIRPSDDLLWATRRAAAVVPGELPVSIRVLRFNRFRTPASTLVEGAPVDSIGVAHAVFQIQFPRGWIMVDAGLGREFLPNSTTFSEQLYDRAQQALRDARLVVITHEHHDHVAGIVRSPNRSILEQNTILTRAQVQTLTERPNSPLVRLDSAQAARFLVIDYDPLIPIAPGVVLIKAAGHTPGSQMIFVRLASGREVLLAGDIAWAMAGIETQHQKPEATSRSLREDRDAIGRQLRWLRDVAAGGITVVAAHDDEWLTTLVRRGTLQDGVDLSNR